MILFTKFLIKIKKTIITYYKSKVPLHFQFKFLYVAFIVVPINDIISTYLSFSLEYYKGFKNNAP